MPGAEDLPKIKEYVEACCRPYFKALERKIEEQLNQFLTTYGIDNSNISLTKISEDDGLPLWNGGPWPSIAEGDSFTLATNLPLVFDTGQLRLVNNEVIAGSIAAIDIGPIANSDLIIPTSKAIRTALLAKVNAVPEHSLVSDDEISKIHEHDTTLSTLDKISESEGLPLWDGADWPKGGSDFLLLTQGII